MKRRFVWVVVGVIACSKEPKPAPIERARDAAQVSATSGWTGPDCSAEHAPRPERDPRPMCWVPPGEFTMGAPDEVDDGDPSPPRRVRITKGFHIDQHEVTVEVFARFLNEMGNRCPDDPRGLCANLYGGAFVFDRDEPPLEVKEGKGSLPIVVATRAGAIAFCEWAGKELPSEAQWEFAARHDPETGRDRAYPWGDEWRDGIANCSDDECLDRSRLETPVGSFPEGVSATGAYDMAGNTDEWVRDCYRQRVECPEPCEDPIVLEACDPLCLTDPPPSKCPVVGVTRGGDALSIRTRIWATSRGRADYGAWLGFRCIRPSATASR
jgi:formylglycine-generating enzyme required for sulfatase activity